MHCNKKLSIKSKTNCSLTEVFGASWSGPLSHMKSDQYIVVKQYLCMLLLLPFMLVISTCCNICVLADLGPWILNSDLEQPSQTSDHGKNVKASINSPICRRGQCSQSKMGRGMR